MLKKLLQPLPLAYWWQEILFLFPRIISGYLLTVEFGSPKFGMPWSPAKNNLGLFEVAFWFPSDVSEFGGLFASFPVFFAWMAAFAEAVGGLGILLGFNTRVFAFLNICTMLVAIFWQQLPNGMWNALPALGFLWVSIYLTIMGGGKYSADKLLVHLINKNKNQ
jgi:putative oxidoreductase